MDMLEPLYGNFDKTVYAGFAVKVAEGAEQGDVLCCRAFEKVGIAKLDSPPLFTSRAIFAALALSRPWQHFLSMLFSDMPFGSPPPARTDSDRVAIAHAQPRVCCACTCSQWLTMFACALRPGMT